MAYQIQEWHDLPATDTPINATRMSHIEQGIYDAWEHGGGESAPIGAIMGYGGTTAPDGWLICDGSAVSRTTYADLFAVIGVAYGGGDNSTTFNIPDYRGMNIVGLKSTDTDFNAIGKTGGEKTHTLTVNEMPRHKHYISSGAGGGTAFEAYSGISNGYEYEAGDKNPLNLTFAGENQPHNNMSPYTVSNVIIKALDTTPTQSNVVNQKSSSTTDTYSCDYVNKLNVYSTEETVIGTYNNKPLYRKIIIGTYNDSANIISNVAELVNYHGTASISGINRIVPFYEYYNGEAYTATFRLSENSIKSSFTSQGTSTSSTINVTFEYTKTTDQVA